MKASTSAFRTARAFALVGAAAAATLAHASYELAFVPSGDGLIRRLDPISGTSFGSLSFDPSARLVQANTATGRLFMYSGSSIFRMNASTGERQGSFPVGAVEDFSVTPDGSVLSVLMGNSMRSYDTATGALISTSALDFGVGPARSIHHLGGDLLMIARSPNIGGTNVGTTTMVRFSTMTQLGTYQFAGGSSTSILVGKSTAVRLSNGQIRAVVPTRFGNNTIQVNTTLYTAAGTIVSSSGVVVSSGFLENSSRAIAALPSHDGFYLLGADAAGNTRIVEYDGLTNTQLSSRSYAFPTPSGFFAPSIMVAPEPGTMLALGAGLAVLARRRRSRR